MNHQLEEFSFRTRADNLQRFGREVFDLVVVGGGITGAGIAWDGAIRGLRVALVEKEDFASGTSSRSSQLIHGGFRYLQTLQLRLVWEACSERHLLRRSAPGLVRPLPFLFPVYRHRRPGYGTLRAGMWLYDALAAFSNVHAHRMVDRREALQIAPGLNAEGLRGGALYYDCVTDDARLTLEVIKAAADQGAVVANYTEAQSLLKAGGKVCGVAVHDRIAGREVEIRGQVVINATGVWLDRLRRLDDPSCRQALRPTKGIHLLLSGGLLVEGVAVVGRAPQDRRPLFVLPWHGHTLVGTTDTDYQGDLECPRADAKDVAYLLESLQPLFPRAELAERHIVSTYAGLRPLIDRGPVAAFQVPRDQAILESASGLISIGGGKLTLFRRMARQALDLALKQMRSRSTGMPEARRCRTDRFPLREESPTPPALENSHLVENYGPRGGREVLEIARREASLAAPIVADLPYLRAEIPYIVRHEMALTLSDVLARRLRLALLDSDHGLRCAEEVARLMGQELGWTEEKQRAECAAYANRHGRGESVGHPRG